MCMFRYIMEAMSPLLAAVVLASNVVPMSVSPRATVLATQRRLNSKQLKVANFELFRAASVGDLAKVKRLLDKGADVNAREEERETPLMYAAVEGHTDVAFLLVRSGADVNALSDNYESALGRAAARGREATVNMLLSNGANIELGGRHLTTPLMAAASNDQVRIVKLLITKGASVNVRDDIGNTALTYAIIKDASLATVEALLDAGADVHISNKTGLTPLILARKRSSKEIVRLLEAKAG